MFRFWARAAPEVRRQAVRRSYDAPARLPMPLRPPHSVERRSFEAEYGVDQGVGRPTMVGPETGCRRRWAGISPRERAGGAAVVDPGGRRGGGSRLASCQKPVARPSMPARDRSPSSFRSRQAPFRGRVPRKAIAPGRRAPWGVGSRSPGRACAIRGSADVMPWLCRGMVPRARAFHAMGGGSVRNRRFRCRFPAPSPRPWQVRPPVPRRRDPAGRRRCRRRG